MSTDNSMRFVDSTGLRPTKGDDHMPWVVAIVMAVVVLFAINAPRTAREAAKPGSPQYEEWLRGLSESCVAMAVKNDPLRSKAEHEASCRTATLKTLDFYPGIRPPRN